MKVYKLTTRDGRTVKDQRATPGRENDVKWFPGRIMVTSGQGDLYGPGFVHAYLSPLLAALCGPEHAVDYGSLLLWECEAVVAKVEGLKLGCTMLVTERQVEVPKVTNLQRLQVAMACVGNFLPAGMAGHLRVAFRDDPLGDLAALNLVHVLGWAAHSHGLDVRQVAESFVQT